MLEPDSTYLSIMSYRIDEIRELAFYNREEAVALFNINIEKVKEHFNHFYSDYEREYVNDFIQEKENLFKETIKLLP